MDGLFLGCQGCPGISSRLRLQFRWFGIGVTLIES
jgi:hypothetical protein